MLLILCFCLKEHGAIVLKLKFVSEKDKLLERYGHPKFEKSAILSYFL
jgi:hypothetical protein